MMDTFGYVMATLSSTGDTFPLMDLVEQSVDIFDPPPTVFQTPPPPPISGRYDFDYVEYMNDLTDVQTSWSEDRAFLPATTVYSLTFVLGILGNGFVILALLSGWRVGRTNEGVYCIVTFCSAGHVLHCVPVCRVCQRDDDRSFHRHAC